MPAASTAPTTSLQPVPTEGTLVTWTSQAGGTSREKVGRVLFVVPPHTPVEPYVLRFQRELNLLRSRVHYGGGAPRDHESYLVLVVGSSRQDLYWPRTSSLSVCPEDEV